MIKYNNINSLSEYIDKVISIKKHKYNLLKIYNKQTSNFNLYKDKSYELSERVLKNKILSKLRIKEEENYNAIKDNKILSDKIKQISCRKNNIAKLNNYSEIRAKMFKNNVNICRKINNEKIEQENKLLGIRLIKKEPFIKTKKCIEEYNRIKHNKNRKFKNYYDSLIKSINNNINKSGFKGLNSKSINIDILKNNKFNTPFLKLNSQKIIENTPVHSSLKKEYIKKYSKTF